MSGIAEVVYLPKYGPLQKEFEVELMFRDVFSLQLKSDDDLYALLDPDMRQVLSSHPFSRKGLSSLHFPLRGWRVLLLVRHETRNPSTHSLAFWWC